MQYVIVIVWPTVHWHICCSSSQGHEAPEGQVQ